MQASVGWSATWGISGRVVWAIVNKAFTACGLALYQAHWHFGTVGTLAEMVQLSTPLRCAHDPGEEVTGHTALQLITLRDTGCHQHKRHTTTRYLGRYCTY